MDCDTDAGEGIRRIERFFEHFVSNMQRREPQPIEVAAPRARRPDSWIAWPFPARRVERVRQWGTSDPYTAQFLRVLSYMHAALRSHTMLTQRHVYV